MDEIIALCKRRGFFYPASEIYGGLANTWDFGHYGTLLKNNLRDLWWDYFVLKRDDMVGIDASIFLSPRVWEASGHVVNFTDALVDCKNCHYRTRADHLIEDNLKLKVEGLPVKELTEIIKKNNLNCPKCGQSNFTDVRRFNLLFETKIGIVEEKKSLTYLRGEIAQGIFLNFKNVLNTMRVKLPFGIAQQGKAFRNEITMGQALYRTLEFDLMEFEYFIQPENWQKIYAYWQEQMWHFALLVGLEEKKLRWREHQEFERSHYSKKTMDIEYYYPFGWKEIFGLAYRTDFDLKNHMLHSGKDLNYLDPQTHKKFIPHVIEPTFGLSRLTFTLLVNSYRQETIRGKKRYYLAFNPQVAPIKLAVFPLQKDAKLITKAQAIYQRLKASYVSEFDSSYNIGQMYRRQDEIGTPYCLTVDYQTLDDETLTVRERDSMSQERVGVGRLDEYLRFKLKH